MLRVFKKFINFSSEKNKKYIFLSLLLGVFSPYVTSFVSSLSISS